MRAAGALAAVALLGACAELPGVTAGVCGNGVHEPLGGEECDGSAGCGAPDDQNACRFVCDGGDDSCPTGMQCGGDGRCRTPTETFQLVTVQTAGPYGASTADMDGDRAADLLGYDSRGLLIRWGGDDAAVFTASTRVSLPFAPFESAVPDVDGDGARDLAITVADIGYGLFLADGARGLVPAAQSAVDLETGGCEEIVAGTIRTDGNTTDEPEILLSIGGAAISFIDQDQCGADPTGDCLIVAGGGAVVGDGFATLALGYGAASGVDPDAQFTIAVEGAAEIAIWGDNVDPQLLRPEKIDTWPLDEPIGPGGGVWLGRVDDDLCPDLVVDTGASLQVVYGNCFGLTATDPVRMERPPGAVLGAGDVDADGTLDLIYAVELESSPPLWVTAAWSPNDRGPWAASRAIAAGEERPTDAIVLDYNRDGGPDVALAHEGAQTVDFLMGYGATGYTRFAVDVGGVPRHMARGDFDGDLHEDVTVTVANPTDPEGRDRVLVLYGEPDGRPTAQFVGEFLADARPARVSGGIQSQIDSVLVMSNRIAGADECAHSMAVLIGDTTRLPLSPFVHLLGEGPTAEPAFPLQVVDVSQPGVPRALAVGLRPGPAISLSVLDFVGTNFTHDPALEATIDGAELPLEAVIGAVWRTGDVDGDPATVEAIAFGGEHVATVTVGDAALTVAVEALAPSIARPVWVELADVDGDRDLDALGMSEGGVWLIENGGGGLDVAAARVLALPDTLACVAADALISTESGLPQLAAICHASTAAEVSAVLVIATIEGGALLAPRIVRLQTADLVGLEIDDFTGDGLDDVAVLGTQTVTLYRQCREDEVFFGGCETASPL